jgi:heptosyltransferase-3
VAGLDISLPVDTDARHEVEDVFRIAKIYGIDGVPPPCRVVAGAVSPAPALCVPSETLTIGVHISARKPSQRWPAERFARTMQAIAAAARSASCCFGHRATTTTRCIRVTMRRRAR